MPTSLQASDEVARTAGGAFAASLNVYDVGGDLRVCTVQVDRVVYVVGQDDFSVSRHTLEEWLGREPQDSDPAVMRAATAVEAFDLLTLLQKDSLLWQCGGCDAWIRTTNRPRIGVLECSTCGDGGVDFRHADRHVGSR